MYRLIVCAPWEGQGESSWICRSRENSVLSAVFYFFYFKNVCWKQSLKD